MKPTTRILSALAVLALSGVATAQENTPVPRDEIDPSKRMAMHVVSYAFRHTEGIFPPEKMLLLAMIAKQRVAAESCDGIEMDNAKYTTVINAAMAEVMAATAEGDNNLVLDRIMYAYGLLVGGEMAVAAYDPDAYCSFGEKLRRELQEDDTEGRVFVLQAAN